MLCKCGQIAMVKDTRHSGSNHNRRYNCEEGIVYRTRKCPSCKTSFQTMEIPVDRIDDYYLELQNKSLRSRIKQIRRTIVDLERLTRGETNERARNIRKGDRLTGQGNNQVPRSGRLDHSGSIDRGSRGTQPSNPPKDIRAQEGQNKR